ncbi:MAG: universal stress protein [Bacteroidia bacterium]
MNFNKILIAVDDGPTCEMVAAEGYKLAKSLNAEIALLSVVDTTFLTTEGSITPRELANIMRNDLRKKHQLILKEVFDNSSILTFVEEGKPYEEILNAVKDWGADIIVIGTHGRTGLNHLLMGSVAEKLVRHSTKPLYIIPTQKHE